MKNQKVNQTLRLTLSSILSALSFAALYIGCVTGVFDLCAVVVGALCTTFAVIELGGIWPYLICAVSTVLSVILLPDKMVALEYFFLGGVYPILKYIFEGKFNKAVQWILKFVYLNLALTAVLVAAKLLFPFDEAWDILGPVTYVVCNLFFLLYDYAMTTFISYYIFKLRKRFKFRI